MRRSSGSPFLPDSEPERPSRRRLGIGLAVLGASLLPMSLALLAILGLSAMRGASPVTAGVAAISLTLLPPLGLAGLVRYRPWALGGALGIWSLLLVGTLPVWFPGERAEAFARGVAFVALEDGEPWPAARALGNVAHQLLGGDAFEGKRPPGPALPVAPPPAPAAPLISTPSPAVAVAPVPPPAPPPAAPEPASGGGTIQYEGEGNSLRVPVVFEGSHGELELPWMLWDTGATFTTLPEAMVRKLGVTLGPDAPKVSLQAATGAHEVRLAIVPRVQVGGHIVEGVTVAVCDTCASEDVSGLLGLNVTSQFVTTHDPAAHKLTLLERPEPHDRRVDLSAWMTPSGSVTKHGDGKVTAEIIVTSRAERSALDVVVELACPDQNHEIKLSAIPVHGRVSKTIPLAGPCENALLKVVGGTW